MSQALTPEERAELLRRARLAASAALGGEAFTLGPPTSPGLLAPSGCFVTFKRRDVKQPGVNLRGCLGTLETTEPLWKNVDKYGADTVTSDYRFRNNPVTLDEMPNLHIDISAIRPKEKRDDPLDFELGVEGVEVHGAGDYAGYRGVYLPQVATEFNLTKEGLLSSCCEHKAGLSADAWRDPAKCTVYAFGAEVFGEDE